MVLCCVVLCEVYSSDQSSAADASFRAISCHSLRCCLCCVSHQDNAIGDDGVIAMTEALMRNGRLRTVCLDGNKVCLVK